MPSSLADGTCFCMGNSDGYKEFLTDLLSAFGPVSIRNMFGGAGVYAEGVMFALVADDTLYFKADATSAPDFAAEGKTPFTYTAEGRAPVAMSYWEIPERLLDDPEELAVWARRAHDIARAAKTKPKRR
ncbi:MAG: TfoX/Sxy family protein [Methyloceanibacter sp.]